MSEKIKELREKYRVSRGQFCRDFGIPERTVVAWDRGERSAPEWAEKLLIEAIKRKYAITED